MKSFLSKIVSPQKTSKVSLSIANVQGLWNRLIPLDYFFIAASNFSYKKCQIIMFVSSHRVASQQL